MMVAVVSPQLEVVEMVMAVTMEVLLYSFADAAWISFTGRVHFYIRNKM